MHISEGILAAPVLLCGASLAGVGTLVGLRSINMDRIMTVAILSSAFFVASLIHVPIGPGSVHLLLSGLMGVMLGWGCVPAIAAALLLQAVFFQFGGFTVLGVNIVIMAGPALLCGLLVRPFLGRGEKQLQIAAFLAGFVSIALSALLMALALISTDQQFWLTAKVVLFAHLPIMVVEGLVTMFVVRFVHKVQPDMLEGR